MPYVAKERRKVLDNVVRAMLDGEVCADGDLNYILFKFCRYHVVPGYNNYKNFCGELRQCATEIERRILGPYEDSKIVENGDV